MGLAAFALMFALLPTVQSQSSVSIDGTWVVVAAAGAELPPTLYAALIFGDGRYQSLHNGEVRESGALKLDMTTHPWRLDLIISQGPHTGKVQLALVDVAGDQLTMALAEPGAGQRPESLSRDTVTLARIRPIPKSLEGQWHGVVEGGGAKLRVAIQLKNDPAGLATGTLVSVDQGNREAPIAAVVVRGTHVKLLMPAIKGAFDAELKDGQLVGNWTQPGGTRLVTLQRK